MDLSDHVKNSKYLTTKVVAVDRRNTCCHRVESLYYTHVNSSAKSEDPLGICAFCGCALQPSQTEKLKELLTKGDRVHPNCGKQSCLKLNPKANFKDGWTVKKSNNERGGVLIKKSQQNDERKRSRSRDQSPKSQQNLSSDKRRTSNQSRAAKGLEKAS